MKRSGPRTEPWGHRELCRLCYVAGGGSVCITTDLGRAVGNVGGEPVEGNAFDADGGESVYEDIVVKGYNACNIQ